MEVSKTMNKLKILIPIRDLKYYEDIKPALAYLSNDKYDITYLSYDQYLKIENLLVVENYYSEEASAKDYLVENSLTPELHKCDPRHFYAIKSEGQLIIEQANIDRYFKEIIKSKKIDIIFSGAATYNIWTVPHEIAKSNNIHSYRMFDMSYINVDISQPRTWFSQDIYMQSWEKDEHKFKWVNEQIDNCLNTYIDQVEKNNINLSQTALLAQNDFYANSIFLFFKNIIRFFFRNDNKSLHRIKSIYNVFFTKKKHTRLSNLDFNFLIYPLNALYDEQLLLRGIYIKDIYSSIQILCNTLPLGVNLVIKQHPVDPGGLSYRKIKELLKLNKNLYIVDHKIPLSNLIKKSRGMITVNSTSAFDSLINKKPVFVLGRTFYSNSNSVTTIKDIRNLTEEIDSFIKKGFELEQLDSFKEILKNIYYESYPEPNNLKNIDYHEHLGLAIKNKLEIIEK